MEKTFRVTGLFLGESICHRWIPLTKPSDAELRCILWSPPEQPAEQTIESPLIWDAVPLIMTSQLGSSTKPLHGPVQAYRQIHLIPFTKVYSTWTNLIICFKKLQTFCPRTNGLICCCCPFERWLIKVWLTTPAATTKHLQYIWRNYI